MPRYNTRYNTKFRTIGGMFIYNHIYLRNYDKYTLKLKNKYNLSFNSYIPSFKCLFELNYNCLLTINTKVNTYPYKLNYQLYE